MNNIPTIQAPPHQILEVHQAAYMQAVAYAPIDNPAFVSISPPLPAGLSLDTRTGVISGIPTAPTPDISYTMTATNSAGSDRSMFSMQVAPAVVETQPCEIEKAIHALFDEADIGTQQRILNTLHLKIKGKALTSIVVPQSEIAVAERDDVNNTLTLKLDKVKVC